MRMHIHARTGAHEHTHMHVNRNQSVCPVIVRKCCPLSVLAWNCCHGAKSAWLHVAIILLWGPNTEWDCAVKKVETHFCFNDAEVVVDWPRNRLQTVGEKIS